MTKRSFAFSVCIFLLSTASGFAQPSDRFDFKSSYGATATYSPSSNHILIGLAQGRSIATGGFEYTHRLMEKGGFKLEYAGEVSPFFRESDPAISGIEETYDGVTTKRYFSNRSRIIQAHAGFLGQDCVTFYPACVPEYGIQGPNEVTYGFATAPFGLCVEWRRNHRIQPTFTVDAGIIVTQRAIPIDGAALLNYQVSIGPGVTIFTSDQSSFSAEYLYRHISNGNANINPGIDQKVFRFTFSRHR